MNNYRALLQRQAKIAALIGEISKNDCSLEVTSDKLQNLYPHLNLSFIQRLQDKEYALLELLNYIHQIILNTIKCAHPAEAYYDIVELFNCVNKNLYRRLLSRKIKLDDVVCKDTLLQRCNVNKHIIACIYKDEYFAEQLRAPINALYPNVLEYYEPVPSHSILDMFALHSITASIISAKIINFKSFDLDYDITNLLDAAFYALQMYGNEAIQEQNKLYLSEKAQYLAQLKFNLEHYKGKLSELMGNLDIDYLSKVKSLVEIGALKMRSQLLFEQLTQKTTLNDATVKKYLLSLDNILAEKDDDYEEIVAEYEIAGFETDEVALLFAAQNFDHQLYEESFSEFLEVAQALNEIALINCLAENGVVMVQNQQIEAAINAHGASKDDKLLLSPQRLNFTLEFIINKIRTIKTAVQIHIMLRFVNKINLDLPSCLHILESGYILPEFKWSILQKIINASHREFIRWHLTIDLYKRVKIALNLQETVDQKIIQQLTEKLQNAFLHHIRNNKEEDLNVPQILAFSLESSPLITANITEILIKRAYISILEQLVDTGIFRTACKDDNGQISLHYMLQHQPKQIALAMKIIKCLISDRASVPSINEQLEWDNLCVDNQGNSFFHTHMEFGTEQDVYTFLYAVLELNHLPLRNLLLFGKNSNGKTIYTMLEDKTTLWSRVEKMLSQYIAIVLASYALTSNNLSTSLIVACGIFNSDVSNRVIIRCVEEGKYSKLQEILEQRSKLRNSIKQYFFDLSKDDPKYVVGGTITDHFKQELSKLNHALGKNEYASILHKGEILLNFIGREHKKTNDMQLKNILDSALVRNMFRGQSLTQTTTWSKLFQISEPAEVNAAYQAELATLEQYVQRFDMDPDGINTEGKQPFEFAFLAGKLHLVRFLCEKLGVTVHKKRLMHGICMYRLPNLEMLEYICARYKVYSTSNQGLATIEQVIGEIGAKCLHISLESNHPINKILWLIKVGCLASQVEQRNSNGENIFHTVSKIDDITAMRSIISAVQEKYGIDILRDLLNQQNCEGKTTMHLAANNGKAFLRLLMTHGAQATIKDNLGNAPLVYLRDTLNTKKGTIMDSAVKVYKLNLN